MLEKVTYVNEETIISAKNLNDIQDEIINNTNTLKNKADASALANKADASALANKADASALANKVDKVSGKGLSTNDYTTAEKEKLAGLSNYTHPDDASTRHVADADKTKWNGYEALIATLTQKVENKADASALANKADASALANKVDKVSGKGLSTNDYTTSEKEKLAGLSNYTHPNDASTRHVTDAEKNKWNGYEALIATLTQKVAALEGAGGAGV